MLTTSSPFTVVEMDGNESLMGIRNITEVRKVPFLVLREPTVGERLSLNRFAFNEIRPLRMYNDNIWRTREGYATFADETIRVPLAIGIGVPLPKGFQD